MKRLAIVTQREPRSGGVGTIVAWLTDALPRHGYEVSIHLLATSRADQQSRRLFSPSTWPTGPTHTVRADGIHLWGADWVEWEPARYRPRAALTSALDAYDIVQVVSGTPALGVAVSDCTAPTFLQVATTLAQERPAQTSAAPLPLRAVKKSMMPILRRIDAQGVRCVNQVIVENRAMFDWVKGHAQPRVSLIPPGIDTDHFKPAASWDRNRPILAFGRLGETRKDWGTAIGAFEKYVADTRASNGLVLAGRGPLPGPLRDRVRESPLSNRIKVLEDIPYEDLPSLFCDCSVFLQSSLEEGLGLAGVEAMSCGLPMVATATVGSREYVVDGVNGYLAGLGPGASAALASGLQQVLDSGAGAAMSDAAVGMARDRYSSESAAADFVESYEQQASQSSTEDDRGGTR